MYFIELMITFNGIVFQLQDAEANQRPSDDHRRRTRVRHSAEHDRKATL